MNDTVEKLSFEERVAAAEDVITQAFENAIGHARANGFWEPLMLRDTDLTSVLTAPGLPYPYRSKEDALDTIAVLNSAVYNIESILRSQGFVPTERHGVICDFTYEINSGYWYRDNIKWYSIAPMLVIDIDGLV